MVKIRTDILFDMAIKKGKIRKSNKFPGSYIIPGYNGHYFVHEAQKVENGLCIPYVFYTYKWYEDNRVFTIEQYNEIMQSL